MTEAFIPEKENTLEQGERRFALYAESQESAEHPLRNEDAFFVDNERRAFGIFDGLGGADRGEVASHLAALYVESAVSRMDQGASPEETAQRLSTALVEASELLSVAWRKRRHMIRRLSRGLNTPADGALLAEILSDVRILVSDAKTQPDQSVVYEPNSMGYGTTAVIAQVVKGTAGDQYVAAAVAGDSRLYRYRKDGLLEQCTLDDHETALSMPEAQRVMQRRLASIASSRDFQNKEEREAFHFRNIVSQGLGIGGSERDSDGPTALHQVRPQTLVFDIHEGDILCALSDGIFDNLTDEEIQAICKKSRGGNIAEALIHGAYDRALDEEHIRHKPDDMTAIIFDTNVSATPHVGERQEDGAEGTMWRRIRLARSEKDFLKAVSEFPLIPGDQEHEWHDVHAVRQHIKDFFEGRATLDDIPNAFLRRKAAHLISVQP